MHGNFYRVGNKVCDCTLQLGLKACGIDVLFALHESVKSLLRDVVGFTVFLSLLSNLCVVHASAVKEISVHRSGLKRSDRNACTFELGSQTFRKREIESF